MCDASREVFSSIAVQVIDYDLVGELRTCIAWSETQLFGQSRDHGMRSASCHTQRVTKYHALIEDGTWSTWPYSRLLVNLNLDWLPRAI